MSIRRNWVELVAAAVVMTGCARVAPAAMVTHTPSSTGSAACFAPAYDPSAPPARSDAMFAVDVDTHSMVLFGGHVPNASGQAFDDTWTWDGTWTEQRPPQSPTPGLDGAMAYDPIHHDVVLYEPARVPNSDAETWTWDGTSWTQQTPLHTPPSRIEPAMASDPALSGVVLVGGTESSDMSDVWGWNGTDWSEVFADHGPIFGAAHAVTVSPKDGSLYVTGNVGAYEFFNGGWTSLNVPWPDVGSFVGNVAYMAGGGPAGPIGFVRFSDRGTTSTWRPGQDASWRQLAPSCSPPARWANAERPQMAFDDSRDGVVLFGGEDRNDTWTFDGQNWSPAQSSAPTGSPSPTPVASPVTGSWTQLPQLATGRVDQTATVLKDGRVLVVGGSTQAETTQLANVEIFDPANNTWSAAGSMSSPRARHTATLLPDGRVLVVGGLGPGRGTAELYDPATNTWSSAGKLLDPRANHAAVLLPDGTVLVVGGRQPGKPLASVEVFDPATGQWKAVDPLPEPRDRPQAILLNNGKVLVTGGVAIDTGGSLDGSVLFGSPMASTELYDPSTQTWSAGPSMAYGRVGHAMVTLNDGRVLVVGGTKDPSAPEIYDPAANAWTATTMLPVRIAPAVGVLPDGTVVVASGLVEQYDPATVASTGYTPVLLSSVDLYTTNGVWEAGAPISVPRWLASGAVVSGGRFLVIGGGNPLAAGSYAVEAFHL